MLPVGVRQYACNTDTRPCHIRQCAVAHKSGGHCSRLKKILRPPTLDCQGVRPCPEVIRCWVACGRLRPKLANAPAPQPSSVRTAGRDDFEPLGTIITCSSLAAIHASSQSSNKSLDFTVVEERWR